MVYLEALYKKDYKVYTINDIGYRVYDNGSCSYDETDELIISEGGLE